MILVTGSTGTNGSLFVEELVALGAPVRAMVRTPEKASSVEREGVEAVVADFGAPETLDAALEGVERAFLYVEGMREERIHAVVSEIVAPCHSCGAMSSCRPGRMTC